MIQKIRQAIQRNQACPCGSGLKMKRCHGSETIKLACQKSAALMFLHCITPLRLQAKVIKQDEHDQIMSHVDTALIEMVTGKESNTWKQDNSDVVESEDRKQEQRDVNELQNVVKLVRCPKCGRPVPAGTKCIKCGEVVNE